MEALPRQPRGSVIWVDRHPGGPTLYWRYPSGRTARVATAAFFGVFLALWSVAGVGAVVGLAIGGGGWTPVELVGFALVWLPFWAFGLAVTFRVFLLLINRPRPESLALGPRVLSYDPGSSPLAEVYSWGGHGWGPGMPLGGLGFYRELFRPRKPVASPREGVTDVRLEQVQKRTALVLEVGPTRVEVGSTLGEADRAWLLSVLAHWWDAEPVAPPARAGER